MDELINIVVLLLFLVVPIIKAVFDSRAEAKKQQEAKRLGKDLVAQAVQKPPNVVPEDVVLAEIHEPPRREAGNDFSERPRKPKLRPKSSDANERRETAFQNRTNGGAAVSPERSRQSHARESVSAAYLARKTGVPDPQSHTSSDELRNDPLVTDILTMFRTPASMRQAVLVSEILKRPEERHFFEK